jgi:two-component system sensor histidine kinase/response regulator
VNVLIVDDQPTNLKLLQAQLQAAGHVVTPATNGVEALDLLRRQGADAVISDILMPRMDGYLLCYEVRKNPAWASIPFIFYSATYTSPSDERLCLDLGGDRYLQKPCSVEVIVGALQAATRRTTQRTPQVDAMLTEADVMQEYSKRLVSKLEEKQIALQRALDELETAHEEILALNQTLEQRVGDRTFELAAANRELEAFSYSVSHDLRAPLRSIEGFLQLFRKEYAGQLPELAVGMLERTHENAVLMGRLIEGLLAFSRFSRAPLKKEKVSLQAIVKQVIDQLEPDRQGRDVQITVGDLPECDADPTLLRQVLANLLSNAIKYSRRRDPAIIEIGWRDEQVGRVYFVRDNGVGFAMDEAERLFGAFERLHDNTEYDGIGIGLSIVKRIVERHGGRIWAESKLQQGATFYFTLGVSPASEPGPAAVP